MSYSHLTITDRIKIETYLDLGLKPCQIASKLGVHKSTISRELSRCKNGYSAALAQEQYDHRAKQKGRKSCLTPKLKKKIEKGLKASWSPEQICGRYQLEQKPMVAFKTIYNWLYAGLIDLDLSVLRRKGKSRQPKETRGTFRIGTSIAKRPKEALKTFTSDRGKEFACYPLVENLGIPFFFADAYSSWQRGRNENSNGLLREYFPKKTDLAAISDEALNKALYDINHRPRKCLAYRTACEALEDEFK